MKKILLTTAALMGLVLACNAISVTERIILSKTVETAPTSLVSEGTVDALLCSNTTYRITDISSNCQQVKGPERLALMALKNIGSLLVKGLCTLAKSDYPNQPAIPYVNGYDTRLMIRTNFASALR